MRIARRTVAFAVVAIAATFLLAACGRHGGAAKRVIGVSLLTRGHLFYRDLEAGLQQRADSLGWKLIITSGDFDPGKQMSQIEDFVTRRVDAIVLCPADSRGVGPGVARAAAAGIPVFTADIAAENSPVTCHIASDNVAGGRLAGEFLIRALGGTGKVGIVNQPALTSVLDRVRGFREALAKAPGISIVADVNGQGVRDKALQAAADALQAHPDLDGLFGINDDSALGALDAAEQFGRSGLVIVGYDATPPARDAILRGSALKADVVQSPRLIGTATIDVIARHFSGEKVPAVVPVAVGLVDRASLESAR